MDKYIYLILLRPLRFKIIVKRHAVPRDALVSSTIRHFDVAQCTAMLTDRALLCE
jgi:hypothetical protein